MDEGMKRRCGRRFDAEFKARAVELFKGSGKPMSVVARELGISVWSLARWKQMSQGGRLKMPEPGGKAPAGELEAEVRRLRQENEYLKRQREILKKAIAICSKEGWLNGGMS